MTMPQNNIDKKRIAKNTLILYVRMLFLMLVGFYTVRLLLSELGVEDYGLYNVIFGLVTTFSFFSAAMQSTVQRFLCYELGKSDVLRAKKVFSASLFLFVMLVVLILVLAESLGLWFVFNKLNVPAGRIQTAHLVYQISVFMTIFKVLQIPYIAVVTSHENMRAYSQLSILDAALHFVSVLMLKFIPEHRLIIFTVLYTLSNFVILGCYVAYCWRKFEICHAGLKVEKEDLKSMFSFFSWNVFGAVANISKQQGLNILLNVFCGVVLNATWGIATQVGGAVNQFTASFQQAFNPQILKSYSNADKSEFFDLLQTSSKYSFFLVWLAALPVLLKTEFLLKLWLGQTLPEGVIIFTQMAILFVIIDALSSPLWIAIQATGDIKRYQIELSALVSVSFISSWFALSFGASASFVAVVNVIVNLLCHLYRLFYLHKKISFPMIRYYVMVLIPVLLIGGVGYILGICTQQYAGKHWSAIIVYLMTITVFNVILIVFAGLSGNERKLLKSYVVKKITGKTM